MKGKRNIASYFVNFSLKEIGDICTEREMEARKKGLNSKSKVPKMVAGTVGVEYK